MPLTSKAKVYKHLPLDLADSVVQAIKRPKVKGNCTEKQHNSDEQRKETLKKKHEPSSDTCSSSEEPSTTKRPRTPQSDATSPSVPNTPMSIGSDDPEISALEENVHPLNFTKGFRPPSVMETNSSPPSPVLRSRLQRCDSRTTTSLDNVEMWESDSELETVDSNSSNFDKINGVLINPRKTYNLSELRQAQSSTSSRLAQTMPPSRSPSSTPSPRCQSSLRPATPKKRRPPKLSLPKPVMGSDIDSPVIPERKSTIEGTSKAESGPKGNPIKSQKKDMKTTFDTYVTDSRPSTNFSSSYLGSPAGGTLSLAISRRRDSSKMVEDESDSCCQNTPTDRRPSMVQARKVKFNNIVTVTDGDSNNTDILRSSKNSGQLIKQKYLKSELVRSQSPISRDGSPNECWEMVC